MIIRCIIRCIRSNSALRVHSLGPYGKTLNLALPDRHFYGKALNKVSKLKLPFLGSPKLGPMSRIQQMEELHEATPEGHSNLRTLPTIPWVCAQPVERRLSS